ncbi:uncharacterized protein EMH_0071690 [Eimeria mitis]|uniref:Uncharacterized protein n=1 Tax=Eimeria mitis TaxID=44415 RepID=U6K2S0_9EIME|nr:uncharacterized protein EMH_0071690 [Eimeria mitis]CDJ32020.1 hypothetical protein EMH_0071690 [Eimeria mitis]
MGPTPGKLPKVVGATICNPETPCGDCAIKGTAMLACDRKESPDDDACPTPPPRYTVLEDDIPDGGVKDADESA